MTNTNTGINDRELCVNYPTWEQLVERFKHITETIEKDLKSMGNEQAINSIKIREHNNKYQIVYTLKPTS